MLVKEFKDFSQIQLRQLGAYASMTIEDFIREIESKGKVPNKFYKILYDEIMSQILEGSNLCASESLEITKKVELTPTEQILEKIPLGFIQYYVEEKDYKKSYKAILGVVKNFYQLSTYEHHGNTKLKYRERQMNGNHLLILIQERLLRIGMMSPQSTSFPRRMMRASDLLRT